MKRLLLLRHAKSLRDDAPKDKDRPLNERGRDDAPRMGGHMHHRGYLPQLVLCSTAKRTVETWELLGPELGPSTRIRFTDALYLAPVPVMEKLIRTVDNEVSTLLVIGHNPGMEECAQSLAREPATDHEHKFAAALQVKFPTCALAVLDFDAPRWDALTSGRLIDFVRPKDLKEK